MFTGLIEELGRVEAVRRRGEGVELTIRARLGEQLEIGDSVAIDGACQTATAASGGRFTVFAMRETRARTTLGELKAGDEVHLELALRAGGRFGGHFVQGHVDGVAVVEGLEDRGDSTRLDFVLPDELARYVIAQGSITLAGVSLTVVGIEGGRAWVALIPQTAADTRLTRLRKGMRINVEVDVLARYVERLLAAREEGDPEPGGSRRGLDWETLRGAGY